MTAAAGLFAAFWILETIDHAYTQKKLVEAQQDFEIMTRLCERAMLVGYELSEELG